MRGRIALCDTLNRGGIALETDNLADEAVVTDTDELVHGSAAHSIGNDHGSGDLEEQIIQVRQCIRIHEPVISGSTHHLTKHDHSVRSKSGHYLTI
jgi:hypothetical protein